MAKKALTPVDLSAVPTGTAPMVVASTTVVTNLNADLLDGQHGSYYADITARLGYTPLNKAGDTQTGTLYIANAAEVVKATSDNAWSYQMWDSALSAARGGLWSDSGAIRFVTANFAAQVQLTNAGAVNITGNTAITGTLTAKGSGSAVFVEDRTNSANTCGLYRSGATGRLWHSGTGDAFTFDTSGNCVAGGTLSDSLGNLRKLPRTTGGFAPGQAFVTSSGVTINTGAEVGALYTIYNDSGSPITLTQGGGLTLRLSGTASTGNRTLALRGMATFWCNSDTEYIISGDVT